MKAPVALDTNVMVYFEGLDDAVRGEVARQTLAKLKECPIIVPAQAMLELGRVFLVKFRWTPEDAHEAIRAWRNLARVEMPDETTLDDALTLSFERGLQIFDAMILATAAASKCTLLMSEDMQDGFVWRGCTVVNPFLPNRHPKLMKAMSQEL